MKRYLATYEDEQHGVVGCHIDALDADHAKLQAQQLDPPHEVIGVLHTLVRAAHWTEEDAKRFGKFLAKESSEPPEAEDFDRVTDVFADNPGSGILDGTAGMETFVYLGSIDDDDDEDEYDATDGVL